MLLHLYDAPTMQLLHHHCIHGQASKRDVLATAIHAAKYLPSPTGDLTQLKHAQQPRKEASNAKVSTRRQIRQQEIQVVQLARIYIGLQREAVSIFACLALDARATAGK